MTNGRVLLSQTYPVCSGFHCTMLDGHFFNIPLPIYHIDNIIRAVSNNKATAVGWLQDYIQINKYIFIVPEKEV